MLRSVFYFALGIALALVILVAVALVVTNLTGEDTEPAPAPTATSSAAGPIGPNTQPAPATAPPTHTPDAPTVQPTATPTPVADMARDLEIVTLLRKDAIPAILEPEFLTIAEANEQMEDHELVLGVSVDGDSRAYSVNMLSRHEIANDVVGGVPVAVTW